MKILIFFALFSIASAHEFRFRNNCPFEVWPGIQGNSGKSTPMGGGFKLALWQTVSFNVEYGWGGRIWPRRGCDASGHCLSGDCGNKIQCNGAGGIPPATLAEFTFDGAGGKDFYDVSLVDGYNLPIQIRPIDGTFRKTTFDKYDCNSAGCYQDLNAICPQELAVWSNEINWTIACKSACEAFQTDQYCCRGYYGLPSTCKSQYWPKNYPAIFKQACPDAYSYAYDDQLSTFTCLGNPNSGYEIVFCP
jgi:hypothetical protein